MGTTGGGALGTVCGSIPVMGLGMSGRVIFGGSALPPGFGVAIIRIGFAVNGNRKTPWL